MDTWGRRTNAAVWAASLRLALVLSTLAALTVLALGAAGDVLEPAMVLVVIVVGFTASWVQSGRVARPVSSHRVTLVALRRRVG